MKVQRVRGTQDFLPSQALALRQVESMAFELCSRSGYGEIITPLFEFTEIFHRTMGETSDVIHKETYTFLDRGGESLTLRPEGTAGVARAFLSEGLAQNLPLKLYYAGPMFRYERPQKGRYRQFHQLGVECLGYETPWADVESISLGWELIRELGLSDHCHLEINTLGDKESRLKYREALVQYFSRFKDELSPDSQMRLEKNPLRILDSKNEKDQKIALTAPRLLDHLENSSKKFYDQVKEGLSALGISFKENSQLVRGLDYYCHSVFEFVTTQLGAQGTVLAGGRYDGLIETMGGPATPGVGWAAGIERLSELRQQENLHLPIEDLWVVLPLDEAGEVYALKVAQSLRNQKRKTEILWNGNLGKKLKKANSLSASQAVILGETETQNQSLTLKDLKTGQQTSLPFSELSELLSRSNSKK